MHNHGKVLVLKNINRDDVLVRFLRSGFEMVTTRLKVYRKEATDPTSTVPTKSPKPRKKAVIQRKHLGGGVIGNGKHSQRYRGKPSLAYRCWSRMLARCYSRAWDRDNPGFEGYSVRNDWLNFQNFAKWYYENAQINSPLHQILIINKTRLFKPGTCKIVTKRKGERETKHKAISPYNKIVCFDDIEDFAFRYNLYVPGVEGLISGVYESFMGWELMEEWQYVGQI